MAAFDPDEFVRAAVPGCTATRLENEQTMGYSGARVADVVCETASGPRVLFLKVVEPKPLPETATQAERLKWDRNMQSYANEVAFLRDGDLQEALEERGVQLPATFSVEVVPGRRFAILSEHLGGDYVTLPVYPAARAPEVLRWLAGFHGAFHGRVPGGQPLWEFGTHVHLDRRPPGELDVLPASVSDFCQAFSGQHPFFARPEAGELGARLRRVAAGAAAHLRPGPHNAHRMTLVHGDFKGANYFLKAQGEGCTAIDWQWTGPGVGATDLIYLFCGSVEDEVVDNYEKALQLYHEELGVEGYSFEELLSDFKVATLDYARWAFSVRLVGDTPQKFQQRAENVDVNMGHFRRHPPRIQWLLQLVEAFLPEAESGKLFSK